MFGDSHVGSHDIVLRVRRTNNSKRCKIMTSMRMRKAPVLGRSQHRCTPKAGDNHQSGDQTCMQASMMQAASDPRGDEALFRQLGSRTETSVADLCTPTGTPSLGLPVATVDCSGPLSGSPSPIIARGPCMILRNSASSATSTGFQDFEMHDAAPCTGQFAYKVPLSSSMRLRYFDVRYILSLFVVEIILPETDDHRIKFA